MRNSETQWKDDRPEGPLLDGSWELPGKNPVVAAIIGLVSIGLIYSYAQGILTAVGMMFTGMPAINDGKENLVRSMQAIAETTKQPIRIALVIAQYLGMMLPAYLFVRRLHSSTPAEYVGWTPVPIGDVLTAVAGTLLAFPSLWFINDFLASQLHVPEFLARINNELFASYTSNEFLWLVLVVGITPAICEETFFRGFVQRSMGRRLGIRSVVIVGVIFGLFHQQPLGLISLSALGMLFGFFFHRSGSLLPGAAAHFTNNLAALVASIRSADGSPAITFPIAEYSLFIVAGSIPLCILTLQYFHHRTRGRYQIPDTNTIANETNA